MRLGSFSLNSTSFSFTYSIVVLSLFMCSSLNNRSGKYMLLLFLLNLVKLWNSVQSRLGGEGCVNFFSFVIESGTSFKNQAKKKSVLFVRL